MIGKSMLERIYYLINAPPHSRLPEGVRYFCVSITREPSRSYAVVTTQGVTYDDQFRGPKSFYYPKHTKWFDKLPVANEVLLSEVNEKIAGDYYTAYQHFNEDAALEAFSKHQLERLCAITEPEADTEQRLLDMLEELT